MCKKEVLSQILLPLGNLSFLSFSFWPCFQVDWDVEVVVVVVNVVVVVVVVDVLNGFAETFKTIFSVTGGRKKAEMGFRNRTQTSEKIRNRVEKKNPTWFLFNLKILNWSQNYVFAPLAEKVADFWGVFPKRKLIGIGFYKKPIVMWRFGN